MAASMATKADLLVLTTTIQDALRAEMAGIRTEVASQGSRLQELEHSHAAQTTRLATTDTALTRQGDLLLQLRRSVEDLDNRGRRNNIRVCGMPETDGEEDIEESLTPLFCWIMPEDAQLDIRRDTETDGPHSAGQRRYPASWRNWASHLYKYLIGSWDLWRLARDPNALLGDAEGDHRRNAIATHKELRKNRPHPDTANPPGKHYPTLLWKVTGT
ncbi:Hypothetical predicted protein [Pelobates cultripes]|uniref:Uncharacterized protein n=1 Tax=Pelobates cultripes TaxID=61616 RepID=A0AAD1W638_PELCU|nr:Hypothetical predicted protein [Pelobates cultripes]